MIKDILIKCEAIKSFLLTLDNEEIETNYEIDFVKPDWLTLPEDYNYFMNWSNGISIFGCEILGISNKQHDLLATIHLEQNKTNNCIPNYIIPFSPVGNGDFICFNLKNGLIDGLCPIIYWQWDYSSEDNFEKINDSFVDWLAVTINEMNEEE